MHAAGSLFALLQAANAAFCTAHASPMKKAALCSGADVTSSVDAGSLDGGILRGVATRRGARALCKGRRGVSEERAREREGEERERERRAERERE